MINILDEYLKELLNEDYSSSIGTALARKKNDPLYKKMIFYKHMYLKTKEQLQKKYRSQSMTLARKKASKY